VNRFLLHGFVIVAVLIVGFAPQQGPTQSVPGATPNPGDLDSLRYPAERHLKNVRQMTFGGNNAEAYFSFDSKRLIFQTDWAALHPQGCDQIFEMNLAPKSPANPASQYTRVSTGTGRTTCSYYLKDGRRIFASTHAASSACPETPRRVGGKYVWGIYDSFDIYVTDDQGKNPTLLIGGPGYDAEATVSPDGRYIVYTSTRSGDLELWRYDLKTKENLQLTRELGYDGGAFFSPDSKQLVFRASRPSGAAADEYMALLKQNVVEPTALQIFTCDIDGKNQRQITNLAGANWAPYFHPSGKKIMFCSNYKTPPGGRPQFNLFMTDLKGENIEQLSYDGVFDAFAVFSPDGKTVAFASNRNNKGTRDTNVFIAEWVE
jgi:TolB protein